MMGERISGFSADLIELPFASGAPAAEDLPRAPINAAMPPKATEQTPALPTRRIAPELRSQSPRPLGNVSPIYPASPGALRPTVRIGTPSLERRLWPQAFSCGQHADLRHDELREIGVYAALAEFPYQLDLEKLSTAVECADSEQRGVWAPLNGNLAKAIAAECGLTYDSRGFSDGDGGMKAYIFVDEAKRKATLVFGGTSSTSIGGGSYNLQRLVWGARDQFNQWWANVQSVFGTQAPQSYTDAAKLLSVARKQLGNYKWSTCGHSKGGAEAAFAAAMNSVSTDEVKAVCFCAPPLGASLMNQLSVAYPDHQQLNRYATNCIRHINVEGDPVPALDRVVKAAHIGTVYTLPATELSGPWLVRRAADYVSWIVGACRHVDFRHQVTSFVLAETEERPDEIDSTAMQP
jgi:hypothetical protein